MHLEGSRRPAFGELCLSFAGGLVEFWGSFGGVSAELVKGLELEGSEVEQRV